MKKKVESLFRKAKGFLNQSDISWINEFFLHDKFELVVEFICDKILEYKIIVDEKLGKEIQKLQKKYLLDPKRTWDAIIVKEKETNREYYLFYRKIPFENLYKRCKKVLSEVKKIFAPNEFFYQEDYVEHDEFGLAIEDICYALSFSKKRINRTLFDKIKSLVADMSIDRKYLKGIVVRRKRREKN